MKPIKLKIFKMETEPICLVVSETVTDCVPVANVKKKRGRPSKDKPSISGKRSNIVVTKDKKWYIKGKTIKGKKKVLFLNEFTQYELTEYTHDI